MRICPKQTKSAKAQSHKPIVLRSWNIYTNLKLESEKFDNSFPESGIMNALWEDRDVRFNLTLQ